ncbi:long-chain-fatty-acid--CoA ligase [Anoxybacillus flavithermus NBRC 109594]|uniref:Long-chain-fatty-acid--CoA ligase n=1 Tax=Anoxybacillus flavithermus NBRC 109594 TaxID=1315967 RepID=R4FAQ2_9BACL|nr:fatty acid--CoA ligase [Anoxybacillus flavithermus]GAC89845.1 long-chain-fatty-acid--CoA ligase [Anoxybacillus flavithermus NBRC 109594]
MYLTIGEVFAQTVRKFPKKEALVDVRTGLRYTYEQWAKEVDKLANAFLKAGVRKGDRVSTVLFNTAELATAFFACAKIGAVFNPINFRLRPKEIAYILADATPKIVLFEQAVEPQITAIHHEFPHISFWIIDGQVPAYAASYHEQIQCASNELPAIDVFENDLYAIMYTSGTTGRPKGVMHRHRDMIEQSLICNSVMRIRETERGLVTAPMFHCAELHCCFLPRVHAGATNVIVHHFDPKQVLTVIEQEQITVLFAAPTMWNMLLQEKLSDYDLSSLRIGLYGAAPMAPVLVKECKERLGIDLIQAYGMTEMGPAVTFLYEDEQLTKAGSAGRACLNHEIRIVKPREDGPSDPDDILPPGQVGEIIVKGPCMMVGYYNREDATEKAMYKGWYHSGDLGYMDEDGYLYVADRVDDMIISGGENVYPREVEDVLYEHEGVLDVAVLGEPDALWGEKVVAFVVKKDQQLTAEQLEAFCKQSDKLAPYKRPRAYYFVEALPRNASGKIQKFLLREQMKKMAQS